MASRGGGDGDGGGGGFSQRSRQRNRLYGYIVSDGAEGDACPARREVAQPGPAR